MRTFKWIKRFAYQNGKVCLARGLWESNNYSDISRSKVRRAIKELFPDRATPFFISISHFNDHPDTTVNDVNKVCEMAGLDIRFEK